MFNSLLQSVGLLILRVSFGAMMMVHGLQKLMNFSTFAPNFLDPIGLGKPTALAMAIFAEFFCSILLILGLGSRLATIPLIVTMLVAIVMFHGDHPWEKKELAACYLSVYVALLLMGPGAFALDRFFVGRAKRKSNTASAPKK